MANSMGFCNKSTRQEGNGKMKVTIKDVAEKSGTSAATVSLVLNGNTNKLSPDTCKKVLQAVKELNYRPDQRAVSMKTGKTKTIGLIIPDVSNLFFGEVAKGAEDMSYALQYNVFLCNSNDMPQKDVKYIKVLLDRGVDGIVITTSSDLNSKEMQRCLKEVQQAGKVLVLLDRITDESGITSIALDHKLGGYLATKHLIENGHRKIGCITGPLTFYSAKYRFEGYKKALAEAGIPVDMSYVAEGNYHVESGYELSDQLINKKVSAIFASNDLIAFGIYKRARERGIKIPDDLSVVGFDDMYYSQLVEVPLTTIRQPAYEMGARAVKVVVEIMENKSKTSENILFKPTLVVRNSVRNLL